MNEEYLKAASYAAELSALDNYVITSGKFKGCKIREVCPVALDKYLQKLQKTSRFTIESELRRALKVYLSTGQLIDKIIKESK